MVDLLMVHYASVKAMADFQESLLAVAYGHVLRLVSEAQAGTRVEEGERDESDGLWHQ